MGGTSYSPAHEVEENFNVELVANRQLRSHRWTVPLLHAFKHRQTFHMIFPWADGGNMVNMWATIKNVQPEAALDWFWTQCVYLAEAVAATHACRMLHADIKPENVLCFTPKDGGEMATAHSPIPFEVRLADFGISTQVDGLGLMVGNDWFRHTRTQRPPEIDVNMGGVGLPADVWSLGCVYLDFATWLLLGNPRLLSFAERRIDELNDPDGEYPPIEEDTYFKVVDIPPEQSVNRCHEATKAVVKDSVSEVRSRIKWDLALIDSRIYDSLLRIEAWVVAFPGSL